VTLAGAGISRDGIPQDLSREKKLPA